MLTLSPMGPGTPVSPLDPFSPWKEIVLVAIRMHCKITFACPENYSVDFLLPVPTGCSTRFLHLLSKGTSGK